MKKIKKILIANRSEISSRIQFTCKTLSIKTVAIYCSQDKFLPYVYTANESYQLSGEGATAYLAQDEIIKIAIKAKADAIHPGYGFLSENSNFAKKVIATGIIWIGPTPVSIALMGDKICAHKLMQKVGVPIIPGFYIETLNKELEDKILNEIGYPIILKDPLGGGGKAIKRIDTPDKLYEIFNSTKEEAKKLTGSQKLLLEKYIQNGRHIEIQIAGDSKKFIHLYERDCSIQRRHQKIIEESPCNFVPQKVLDQMYEAAILAAKTVDYKTIGTVEFIVTPNNEFYFLEMNTRLQVEHSVTEQITGIDLVNLQIQITESNKLAYKQVDIKKNKHSIECRIYSEDPENNFLPASGNIYNLRLPKGPFLRNDHNLEESQEITPFFDPMISKLTTWGVDRKTAISNMLQALDQFEINGIKTNIDFLKKVLNSEEFLTGNFHTQLLSSDKYISKINQTTSKTHNTEQQKIAQIAVELFKQATKQNNTNKTKNKIGSNWRNQEWE